MRKGQHLIIPLLLAVAVLFLAACNAAPGDAAVEATPTVVSGPESPADPPPADGSRAGEAEESSPAPAAPAIPLPPLVKDFTPEPRPASSKGDPQAPVVMYEWSDYT